LTTHEVADAEMAARVIDWYRQRWHIEQLFRILKGQGLDIEASQSEDAHALTKLAVMATHAASRVTQLVQARDGETDAKAADLFEPAEIEVMQALLPNLEGKTAKQKNPHARDSLAWCAWVVARLGGWKGYRHSEGPPGPLTMRRGHEAFCKIRDGYLLAQTNVCKP
jgi:Transposase DDE domain